jgi:hypothetical protein
MNMDEMEMPGLPDYPPEFEVGDYVMFYNPYFDEFILTEDNEFVLYEVDAITYDLKDRVYRYRLSVDGESDGLWYNEHWLQPDIFGPLAIALDENPKERVLTPRERSAQEAKERAEIRELKAEVINDLLDEYNDYKRLYEQFGDEEYQDRMVALEAELFKLTEEAN